MGVQLYPLYPCVSAYGLSDTYFSINETYLTSVSFWWWNVRYKLGFSVSCKLEGQDMEVTLYSYQVQEHCAYAMVLDGTISVYVLDSRTAWLS